MRRLFAAACLLLAARPARAAGAAEPFRPDYHFAPARNYMSDPNGLIYHGGRYHLYYQHNPEETRWGNIVWGHAVSLDLVHWREMPVALKGSSGAMPFTGSVVLDRNDTSGLCGPKGCLVAVYTGAREGNQSQFLATSRDGSEWLPYKDNPVLDLGRSDFRDPAVFRDEAAGVWVMTAVFADEPRVVFFRSKDLRRWERTGSFAISGLRKGTFWECPTLLELPIRGTAAKAWFLKVDEGDPAGLRERYFTGAFKGGTFTVAGEPELRLTDHGADFYAAAPWAGTSGSGGSRRWIGWMANARYVAQLPTKSFRGQQSIPRELSLDRYRDSFRLAQTPLKELEVLRGEPESVSGVRAVPGTAAPLPAAKGLARELDLTLELSPGSVGGLIVRKGPSAEIRIGYDRRRQILFVDRTRSGNVAPGEFQARHEAPLVSTDGRVRLRVFLDRNSVEVFSGDGEAVITDLIFPGPKDDGVELYAQEGKILLMALKSWPLKVRQAAR